mmetsp:Transcript_88612/g.286182  ORF Transcript_88612/g.286182 Transcript_88612/m.286182 type:complete len:220 (-) Transcript_88612:371-1030(-)
MSSTRYTLVLGTRSRERPTDQAKGADAPPTPLIMDLLPLPNRATGCRTPESRPRFSSPKCPYTSTRRGTTVPQADRGTCREASTWLCWQTMHWPGRHLLHAAVQQRRSLLPRSIPASSSRGCRRSSHTAGISPRMEKPRANRRQLSSSKSTSGHCARTSPPRRTWPLRVARKLPWRLRTRAANCNSKLTASNSSDTMPASWSTRLRSATNGRPSPLQRY